MRLATWFRSAGLAPSRRTGGARRLNAERLEARRLLAITDLAEITGVSFNDVDGDGTYTTGGANPDLPLSGVTVTLYLDDGDGVAELGGDDAQIDQVITPADGSYTFSNLTANRYWVEQTTPAGFNRPAGAAAQEEVVITAGDADGDERITIDTYNGSTQTAHVDAAGSLTDSSAQLAAEALGGERDLFLQLTSGVGTADLSVNAGATNLLEFASSATGVADYTVSWDGIDSDATTLDPVGLRAGGATGVDLTDGGLADGLVFSIGADQNGAQATIDIYTDGTNASRYTFTIANTGGGVDDAIYIPFADFFTLNGAGADFSDVGAIELLVEGQAALDGQASLLGTVGVTTFTQNFDNLLPLTIGDTVWNDANNNGVFDSATESGVSGVAMTLFLDDGDGNFEPGADDAQVDTTTTDGSGNYQFTDLLPGDYWVQIDASNFAAAGPLENFATSTGNDPTPSPNDGVDDDDNGEDGPGGVVITSAPVSLVAGSLPDGVSGDENLRVDFGFFTDVDLQITKSDDPDPVTPGGTLTYTVTVTNNGPGDATGVTVTETLPNGVTLQTVDQDGGAASFTQAGQVLTIDAGSLTAAASTVFTIVVTVDSTTEGTITNGATVTGNEPDSDTSNNTASEDTESRPEIDLVVAKTADATVVAGESMTYTLSITNNGPNDATGVTVTDTLPAGLTATAVRVGGTSTTFTTTGQDIDFTVGNVAAGAAAIVVEIDVDVDASLTAGSITNSATVAGTEFEDPANETDNTDTADTTVSREVDVAVTKADDVDPVATPGSLVYTLVVTNNGPSVASGVVLTDTLPAETTFTSGSSTGTNQPTEAAGVVTTNIGDLNPGASVTVTINVDVDTNFTNTTISNTATVATTDPDTDSTNNSATETTNVQVLPSSIAGFVYVDLNDNGVMDAGESGIEGVTLTLTGTDASGAAVNLTTTSDTDGSYVFDELIQGTYALTETQPAGFPDGQETAGTPDLTPTIVDNAFQDLTLPADTDAVNFNFGELLPEISKRLFLASSNLL